jgi:hypothetical protein
MLVAAPSSGRIALPDNVIDVRRVVWIPSSASFSAAVLRPADIMSKQFFDQGYTVAAGVPRTFLRSSEPPISFDVDRTPPVAGNYECLVVTAGAPLGTGTVTLLGVPDDWAWVVKWGALAQLFGREGHAKDPTRAEYCLYRYNQGLGLMMEAPVVLGAQIGGLPISVDGVRNGDDFNSSWQTGTPGVSRGTYVAGMNLIGFRDPGTVATTVNLTVVRNHPVTIGANLQIGREDYMAILDYAQHLAALEMGGQEFMQTVPLFKRFTARAALYNSKLSALGDFQPSLYDQTNTEQERNPVFGKKPAEVLT